MIADSLVVGIAASAILNLAALVAVIIAVLARRDP
jgi:hypothetical protein